jgi:MSHA biogenesis protein MshK
MLLAASLLALAPAAAQPLADPTRPPGEGAAQAQPGDSAGGRLQSVLISSRRSVAVIDGRTVALGERVGDATLVSIAPAEVVLQRGAERRTLKLHAGLEKKRMKP